ncbi:MAG: NADAR family protein [Anaerolineae bacterium]|nr:NADAR family protein [Anaerolineae bacterium]
MPIYFYSVREKPYGCFSNFSRHGIPAQGVYWPTVEHYFQAQKFPGTDYEQQIRLAKTPKQAKALGQSRQHPLRPDWEAVKDGIMAEAVLLKFQTHAELRAILLGTGDEVIVENAPNDFYWGCGADGSGLNKLGQILMQVRAQLRAENA